MANEPENETAVLAPEPPRQRIQAMLDLIAMLPNEEEKQVVIRRLLEFEQDSRLAGVFAASGQFSELKGMTERQAVATAMAKISLGRGWDLNPTESMEYVYFTNGRPGLMNEVVQARLKAAGYDWDVQWHEEPIQHKGKQWRKCIGCTLWLKFNGQPVKDTEGNPVSVSFTEADADNAEIWENGQKRKLSEKFNYKSWPRSMYFWRCIAQIKRFYAPSTFRGIPMLVDTEDEPPPVEQHVQPRQPEEKKQPTLAERIIREREENAELFGNEGGKLND